MRLGLGCNLHGDAFLQQQTRELVLRGQVQKPVDALRSATSVNAEIVQMQGRLGQITPGAFADMILLAGDPMTDLALFDDPLRNILLVVKGGRLARDRRAP